MPGLRPQRRRGRGWVALAALALATTVVAAQEAQSLTTQQDKLSYAIGVDLVRNLQRQGTEVNGDLVARGVKDALAGGKLALGEGELRNIVISLQSQRMRNQRQSRVITARENGSAGAMFLLQNKTNAGVVVLPDGLQYRVVKAGTGRKPADAGTVECVYRGTFIDGTQFDASPSDGTPAVFKVSEVIPGWKEALKLMPEGSKWRLFVPPNLAYGLRGKGQRIGPGTTLIFDFELVRVR